LWLFTGHYVTSREVLQGVPVHFNCTPACVSLTPSSPPSASSSLSSGVAKVVWHFSDTHSAHMLRMDYSEHFLTHENGLILLDVKVHHHGNFTCSINGHVTARHELKVLREYFILSRFFKQFWAFSKHCCTVHTFLNETLINFLISKIAVSSH